jgi:hypothetical protein
MTPRELLQRWKKMSGDTSSGTWVEENTYGFFNQFRDDPVGLKKSLSGIPKATAIASRLQAAFDAAAPSGDDEYLVVRTPPALAKKKAESLVRTHVKALRTMARDVENQDAVDFLAQELDVRLTKKPAPRFEQDSIDTIFYELEIDWFVSLRRNAFVSAMKEAAYSLAADYRLARYVLWPLLGRRDDPYSAYFELWRHGAELRWHPSKIMLHVT